MRSTVRGVSAHMCRLLLMKTARRCLGGLRSCSRSVQLLGDDLKAPLGVAVHRTGRGGGRFAQKDCRSPGAAGSAPTSSGSTRRRTSRECKSFGAAVPHVDVEDKPSGTWAATSASVWITEVTTGEGLLANRSPNVSTRYLD